MIRTKTCMAVGLLGMTLLFTGCGGSSTRLGHMLFDGTPFESVGSSNYDTRALETKVDKSRLPPAQQSQARVADANVEVQQ